MGTKVKCLTCGKVIQSTYRHDLVGCDCEQSDDGQGTWIFVDGGDDYFRMGHEANAKYEILRSETREPRDKD